MRTKPLLGAVLFAAGASTVLAQPTLPPDWDQKVASVIADAGRARQVVYLGRKFDEKKRETAETMKAADERMKATFLRHGTSVGDRQLSLNVFRDKRRKAANAAIDSLLEVRALVTRKEWKEVWPEGYLAAGPPPARLVEKVQEALPAVVTDPARLKQAQDVAAALVKATRSDVSAGKKARGRLEDYFANYETPQDDFVELVNQLDEDQEKHDDAVIEASGRLQAVLTPEEWGALAQKLGPAS